MGEACLTNPGHGTPYLYKKNVTAGSDKGFHMKYIGIRDTRHRSAELTGNAKNPGKEEVRSGSPTGGRHTTRPVRAEYFIFRQDRPYGALLIITGC